MQIPHFLVRNALCHVHLRRSRAGARALRRGHRARHGLRPAQLRVPRAAPARRTACSTRRPRGCARALRALLRARAATPATTGFLRLPADVLSPLFALALAARRRARLPAHAHPQAQAAAARPRRRRLAVAARAAHLRRVLDRARRRAAGVEGQGAEEAARAPEGAGRPRRPRRGRDDADGARVARRRRRRRQDLVRQQPLSPAQAARRRRRAAARRGQALAQSRTWSGSTCGPSRPRSTQADVNAALGLLSRPLPGARAPVPWMLPARDRLQARLVRAVLAAGEALERERATGRAPGRCTSARWRSTT